MKDWVSVFCLNYLQADGICCQYYYIPVSVLFTGSDPENIEPEGATI